MAHEHIVVDTDAHFVIDKATREISTKSGNAIIMQYDHNSERFTFDLPRMIDGHDMMQCNQVQVHYINIGATEEETNADVYDVVDLAVSTEDENIVVLSWLISGNATKFAGVLNFLIKFNCVVDGVVEYAWNTAIYKAVTISNGMNNGETITEEYSDILAAWEARIEALERGGGSQSNWNASEGEPGHVLNRTHWVDVAEEVLVERTYNCTALNKGNSLKGIVLIPGQEYKIVYDGVTYYATAEYSDYWEYVYIGIPEDEEESNGELVFDTLPFFICCYDGENKSSIYFSTIGEHTFSVGIETKTIKRLDEQFMPLLTSPNGTKYLLSVADDGTLSATPTT